MLIKGTLGIITCRTAELLDVKGGVLSDLDRAIRVQKEILEIEFGAIAQTTKPAGRTACHTSPARPALFLRACPRATVVILLRRSNVSRTHFRRRDGPEGTVGNPRQHQQVFNPRRHLRVGPASPPAAIEHHGLVGRGRHLQAARGCSNAQPANPPAAYPSRHDAGNAHRHRRMGSGRFDYHAPRPECAPDRRWAHIHLASHTHPRSTFSSCIASPVWHPRYSIPIYSIQFSVRDHLDSQAYRSTRYMTECLCSRPSSTTPTARRFRVASLPIALRWR